MRARILGFSLLETLVAFSIMAVALGVLMRVFSGAGYSAGVANQYAHAVSLAQSLLTSQLLKRPINPGVSEGVVGDGSRWIMRVTPARSPLDDDPKSQLALVSIDLSVVWGEGHEPREFTLSTLRLIPVEKQKSGWHLPPRPQG